MHDLPVGAELVEEAEALIDLDAAQRALSSQADIEHVMSVAQIEHLEWVHAHPPTPGFLELLPIGKNVPVSLHRRDIGKDGGDVKHRVLGVHLQHDIELAAVPAVEPLLNPHSIEDFWGNCLSDASSIPPSRERAVIVVTPKRPLESPVAPFRAKRQRRNARGDSV